jgi:uncharacterized sporulation protein YeaH/YhbH (DUF444 family)
VLTRGPRVTLARIAERFGVQLATIARTRIETDNRRPSPADWEAVIAELAEAHAKELAEHVKKLRQLAAELRKRKGRGKG